MSYLSKIFKTDARFSRGFTLAEMITVTAIFVIVTGVLLTNLPDFKSRTNIDVAAQQIALNIRGAQVYSIGTKSGTNLADDEVFPSFGVFFQPGIAEGARYVVYRDLPDGDDGPDGLYNPPQVGSGGVRPCIGECEQRYQIDPYFEITKLDYRNSEDGNPISTYSLDINFKRPNVQAKITAQNNTLAGYSGDVYLCSRRNVEVCRIIRIYTSGQIEVLKS